MVAAGQAMHLVAAAAAGQARVAVRVISIGIVVRIDLVAQQAARAAPTGT